VVRSESSKKEEREREDGEIAWERVQYPIQRTSKTSIARFKPIVLYSFQPARIAVHRLSFSPPRPSSHSPVPLPATYH